MVSIARANTSRAERTAAAIPGSAAIWLAVTGFPRSCRVTDASGTTRADITISVSVIDACACVPRGDELKSVTGLSTNSPLPTTQSRQFFKTPGTPWAYSGTENTTPSASRSLDRQALTAGDTV